MKLEDAYALQNMKNTDGWKVVENHVRSRMEDAKQRLLGADTMDKVARHQGQHEALQGLLVIINQTIKEGMNEE